MARGGSACGCFDLRKNLEGNENMWIGAEWRFVQRIFSGF